MRKTKAFTLIELLVVIAIIGILAAMVFPVFARARESARKAVCLSNVKNIALAVQMYLADNNDTLPPAEHNSTVLDYFETIPGGENPDWAYFPTCSFHSNPYLRWPVVLDEYTKNRDVWRCPSAKMQGGAAFMIPQADWLGYLQGYQGEWGAAGGYSWMICSTTWPAGWGGTVTDTILQQSYAVAAGAEGGVAQADKVFIQSVATGEEGSADLKLTAVPDTVSHIIVADGGSQTKVIQLALVAYPDVCQLQCGNSQCGGWVDWEDSGCIEYGGDCGLFNKAPGNGAFLTDTGLRKKFARHLGGVNLGFLDGHASWMASETILNRLHEGELQGASSWGPVSDCLTSDGIPFSEAYPGVPTIF